MASAQTFEVSPATFVWSGPTTMDVDQMQGFDAQTNPTKTRVRSAGALRSQAHLLAFADPMVSFNTRDLDKLMNNVSASLGLCIETSATFRLQEREDLKGLARVLPLPPS